MKITIVAGFSAKRNMYVNACHAAKLLQYKFFIIVIALMLVLKSNGQVRVLYHINANESTPALKLDSLFHDRSSAESYIQLLPNVSRAKGFIHFSIDTVKYSDSLFLVDLYLGKQYRWKNLSSNEKDAEKFISQFLHSQNHDANELFEMLAGFYADKGYPFTNIRIDSIRIQDNSISGVINIDKGNVLQIDSLKIIGTRSVNKRFLENYLNIHKQAVYNKTTLEEVDKRINRLSFVQTERTSEIDFFQTGAVLNIYLKNKPANRINAIIGLMSQNESRKFLLTGDVQLMLQNSFGNGEIIDLNWQQLLPKSPRLHLLFQQPYVGNSKWGIHFEFDLLKKDSAFVNTMLHAGTSKQLNAKSMFNFFLKSFSGSLSMIDTNAIKLSKKLPSEADLHILNFGIGYIIDERNSFPNPLKGFYMSVELEGGIKKIKKNNTILSIKQPEFKSIYDTVQLNAYNGKVSFSVEKYFMLSSNATIKTSVNAASIFSDRYYENEKYRIGGINLLRGFDEQSIFTNRYAVGVFEYRYILDQGSFLRLFSDFGSAKVSKLNMYMSVGAGITLSSKAGQLNLLYAAGKKNEEPLNFKQGKVHLGFSALF
jgi:outer membrane protein assembly factor BamA